MDFFSHLLLGILLSAVFFGSYGSEYIAYAALMAILADFDIILEFSRRIRKSKLLTHKGISHSFFASALVSFISGLFFSIITSNEFLFSWLFGFLFFSLHIILDGSAASKIPLFYPFTKKRYRFFIDRAINPILALLSGGILLFYLVSYFFLPSIFYSDLVIYFLFVYFIYFSYRISSKVIIQARLPKSQKYIPGILPFIYYIYENHTSEADLSFRLFKKVQFTSKKEQLIESNIDKGTKELEFFEKAKKIAEDYIFFSKWENLFPIIWKDQKYIIMLFFLAESYASGTAYSLEMIFDMETGKLIHQLDGFGRISKRNNNNFQKN